MNLRDLQYLVAVADHRHFGRAARACFVSQPTLSTQLKKLEQELGVELLERHPRQVIVTEAGRQVVERARLILSHAASIRTIAQRSQDPDAGTVRMGMFPTLGPYLLPHIVPSLHRLFPKLELLFVEDKTEALLQRLRDGQLDVALIAMPVADDHLEHEVLFDEDFLLAVHRDHPLAARTGTVPLSVLDDAQVLLLEEGHCLREQALSVCRLAGAVERSDFRATSLETLRQMVASEVGVTLLPELAVRPPIPPSDDVRLLRFSEPVPRRRIAMFWRRSSSYGDLMPRLATVMREALGDLVHVVHA